MNKPVANNKVAVAVAACLLGLISVPFLYIATGAPLQLPLRFSLIMGPPLLAGAGLLLWRYLAATPGSRLPKTMGLLEGLSWIVVLAFIYFVSDVNLQSPAERLGLTGLLLSIGALVWAPFLAWKTNAPITARLSQLPSAATRSVLALILLVCIGSTLHWLSADPAFI